MSFDLAIWRAERPITTTEATEIFSQLGEATPASVKHSASIAKFFSDLTAVYPRLEDCNPRQAKKSPWTGAIECTDCYVILNATFDSAEEVVPLVQELAEKHELVVYDPQFPIVHYPPSLARMPHRRLTLESDTVLDDPTPEEIAEALQSLKPKGNSFAIFERQDQHYMQTLKESAKSYIIEYRDGSANQHFHATSKDLAEITAAFVAYSEGKTTWQKQFVWEKLDLASDEDDELRDSAFLQSLNPDAESDD